MTGFVLLVAIATVSVLVESVVVSIRNKNIAKAAEDMSWGWDFRKRGHKLGKVHLIVMAVIVLIGLAAVLLKDLPWIKYIGLGVSVAACLLHLYCLIAAYRKTYGRLRKSNSMRKSFFEYMLQSIGGIKFTLYLVATLCAVLVWAFAF